MVGVDHQLAAELVGAADRGEIYAAYQPQIDLATGRLVGAEALARWAHPGLGLISPNVFIPIAESGELIHSIGRHMIDDALTTASEWRERGVELEVSVNVSANQLTTVEFYDLLEDDLTRLRLPSSALTIEITESQPILDTPSVAQRLGELRDEGLGISVDDFGAGHSSLSQLDRLPATELKIDQSLVQSNAPESLALMSAVVELAHWRGLRVVAEGIETDEQLERMQQLGCDRAQGFLFGRPMDKPELESMIGRSLI